MSFFRYPGGKAKLTTQILAKAKEITTGIDRDTYIEPFFGGGSVFLALYQEDLFPNLISVFVNDKDPGIAAIWKMVFHYCNDFCRLINDYTPTVEDFYSFKNALLDPDNIPVQQLALMKLAIHQMSYSGLGTKAGGPIGGKLQASSYGIDCRWSPASMCKKIKKINAIVDEPINVCVTSDDASKYIKWADHKTFMYIDPPYFDKGDELYQVGFSNQDHIDLAEQLNNIDTPWLLSYDNVPEIRELYDWAVIEEVDVNYTIKTARKKTELLIHPKMKERLHDRSEAIQEGK
jgi:DNA adenine methylase